MKVTKQIHLCAVQGKCESLSAVLQNMVKESLKENGCLRYELYQDEKAQNDFVIYEIWQDEACLQAHKQTPHFLAFAEQVPELVANKSSISLKPL